MTHPGRAVLVIAVVAASAVALGFGVRGGFPAAGAKAGSDATGEVAPRPADADTGSRAAATTEVASALAGPWEPQPGTALAFLPQTARDQLRSAYSAAGWTPRWLDAGARLSAEAREALQILAGAGRDGLEPDDYQGAALSQRAIAVDRAPGRDAAAAAAFDRDLSAAMVLYLRDLHLGRVDPRGIGFRVQTGGDEHDFPALLWEAVSRRRLAAAAAELEPQTVFYRALRGALLQYRSLPDTPLILPPSGTRAVKPGEAYAGLAALEQILRSLGDWPQAAAAPADARTYDGPWVDAVKRFQARHGLEPDGALGRDTIAALRVPVAARVRQIEMGLERLRWLPHVPEGRLITVNIPMFHLWTWDAMGSGGMPVFESRVIVGRALDSNTPVFVEEMSHLIFRPYWNVPPSIARDEILPAVQKDPRYLEANQMELVRGGGDDARPVAVTDGTLAELRAGTVRVRQRPGPANSLGLVKFVFPNDENVYLHGTPSTSLFARSRRDLSHGCVRVEQPVALAEWALSGSEGWTRDRIITAMNGSRPQQANLATPIPVVLFYSTALVVPEDGLLHFAADIYRQDEKLDRALTRRTPGR